MTGTTQDVAIDTNKDFWDFIGNGNVTQPLFDDPDWLSLARERLLERNQTWLTTETDGFAFLPEPVATQASENPKPDPWVGIDHWEAKKEGTLLLINKAHGAYDVYSRGSYTLGSSESTFDNRNPSDGSTGVHLYTRIDGNNLNNIIYGGNTPGWRGDDYGHDDIISGGGGHDIIYGLDGNDKLYGDEGNDILFGGEGHDYLVGGTGNDILFGGEGHDMLFGGSGNDWLYSGPTSFGNGAKMWGGSGFDTFVIGWAPESVFNESNTPTWDSSLEMVFGLGSLFVPKLVIAQKAVGIVRTISDAFSDMLGSLSFTTPKGADPDMPTSELFITRIMDFNPLEDKILIPIQDIHNIDVYLSDDSNPNVVMTIKNALGHVIAEISFAKAEDIFGAEFTGLHPTVVKDLVQQLIDSALMIGPNGLFYGVNGNQKIDFPPDVLAELGENSFMLLGAYGNQEFAGEASGDVVYGTNYDDVISGYVIDPKISPNVDHFNAANDILHGFDGDDLFFAGAGNNIVHGGGGNDTASYEYANRGIILDMLKTIKDHYGTYYEVLNGHMYKLNIGEIIGYDKNYSVENIIGSNQDDIIRGDNSDNLLVSGDGNDVLAGRGGADTFVLTGGVNTIEDFNAADGDKIVIAMDKHSLFDVASFELTAKSVSGGTHLINANTQEIIVKLNGVDAGSFDIAGSISFRGPDGKMYSLIDYSTPTNSWKEGTGGNDILVGSTEKDSLKGGDGHDIILGGGSSNGGDTLFGGSGNDILLVKDTKHAYLQGDAGADTFIFGGGVDSALITDFQVSQGDKLLIDLEAYGASSLSDLTFTESSKAAPVQIYAPNGDLIGTVMGADLSDIPSHFGALQTPEDLMATSGTANRSTDGMVDYNANSTAQQQNALRNANVISDLARRVATTSETLTFTDYGCGPGQSTIETVRPALNAWQNLAPEKPMAVCHADQPGNDWNALMGLVHGESGYVTGPNTPLVMTSVGSFYEPMMPSGSVSLATCFFASHWLNGPVHLSAPDTLWFADLTGSARQAMWARAQTDWVRFLRLRAAELQPGGYLYVSALGAVPESGEINNTAAAGRTLYRAMQTVTASMAGDGLLNRRAADSFVFGLWFLTAQEARSIIEGDPELSSLFEIDTVEVITIDPGDIFAGFAEDPDDYARRYADH
eukprot:g1270.t1